VTEKDVGLGDGRETDVLTQPRLALADQHGEWHPADKAARSGLRRIEVAVRVEPDDHGIEPGNPQAREHCCWLQAIAADRHRSMSRCGCGAHALDERCVN